MIYQNIWKAKAETKKRLARANQPPKTSMRNRVKSGARVWSVHLCVQTGKMNTSEDAYTTETNRIDRCEWSNRIHPVMMTDFVAHDRFLRFHDRKDIGAPLYRPFLLFRGFIGSLCRSWEREHRASAPLIARTVNRIAVESDFLRVK